MSVIPFEAHAMPGAAAAVTVQDRTAWPRLGLRGPATPDWCAATGLPFPETVNTVAPSGDLRVARLGRTELLILADTPDQPLPLPPAPVVGAHDAFRQETWAWFRLDGPGLDDALGALTSADLRPGAAPPAHVVQTRVAGLDAVLVIGGLATGRTVDIFIDIAAADYFRLALGDRIPNLRP